MNKESFMEFYRSEEGYDQLDDEDRKEIFLTVLRGTGDLTHELLKALAAEYGTSLKEITKKEPQIGPPTKKQIMKAKDLLEKAGFFTENLWCIDDVHIAISDAHLPKQTDEYCMEVLEIALTSEQLYQTVWDKIHEHIEKIEG